MTMRHRDFAINLRPALLSPPLLPYPLMSTSQQTGPPTFDKAKRIMKEEAEGLVAWEKKGNSALSPLAEAEGIAGPVSSSNDAEPDRPRRQRSGQSKDNVDLMWFMHLVKAAKLGLDVVESSINIRLEGVDRGDRDVQIRERLDILKGPLGPLATEAYTKSKAMQDEKRTEFYLQASGEGRAKVDREAKLSEDVDKQIAEKVDSTTDPTLQNTIMELVRLSRHES